MKTKELIKYLQKFDENSEVVLIVVDLEKRKKYDSDWFAIIDTEEPVLGIEIGNESDLDGD